MKIVKVKVVEKHYHHSYSVKSTSQKRKCEAACHRHTKPKTQDPKTSGHGANLKLGIVVTEQ